MKRKNILKLTDEQLDKAIKIQGTDYDRKRVVTTDVLHKINKMLRKNYSFGMISEKLGISYTAIRYNSDPTYRERNLAAQSGKHTGIDTMTFENRVAYKRSLVKKNKVSI